MKKKSEILIEGSYSYFKDEEQFAVENFKLIKNNDTAGYQFISEILSNIQNEERLRTNIKYGLSKDFKPESLLIEKSISNKYVIENFLIDAMSQELVYKLKTNQAEQEFRKKLPEIYHLSSPAFCTSTIWTHYLSPKNEFDIMDFIYSNNEWNYSTPPQTKKVYIKLISQISPNYQINNIPVNASEWLLHAPPEAEDQNLEHKDKTTIYVSKDFSIPFELKLNNLRIVLNNLVRHT